MKEQKIIMYDSAEAATYKTVTGWVSSDGFFYGKDENLARYAGCTHKRCECGNVMEKHWLKCEACRFINKSEHYKTLPFKEIDFTNGVCLYDGEKYFFSEDDLIYWMEEEGLTEVDLLLCKPLHYKSIDFDWFADDAHEDWEPTKELENKMDEFNMFLGSLPPHSYEPDNIRTHYKLTSNGN